MYPIYIPRYLVNNVIKFDKILLQVCADCGNTVPEFHVCIGNSSDEAFLCATVQNIVTPF